MILSFFFAKKQFLLYIIIMKEFVWILKTLLKIERILSINKLGVNIC